MKWRSYNQNETRVIIIEQFQNSLIKQFQTK